MNSVPQNYASQRDFYTILGVAPNAGAGEIKRAYRRLVRAYHPDLHPNDPAAELGMRAITRAYAALTRPPQRRETARPQHPSPPDVRRGDVVYRVALTPAEAAAGVVRMFEFCRPNGQPYRLAIQIPSDATNGMRLCVPGEGGPGIEPGSRGDFYVVVVLMPEQR